MASGPAPPLAHAATAVGAVWKKSWTDVDSSSPPSLSRRPAASPSAFEMLAAQRCTRYEFETRAGKRLPRNVCPGTYMFLRTALWNGSGHESRTRMIGSSVTGSSSQRSGT